MDALKLLRQRRSEIATICRRYSVRRLSLFGSAARGTFDPERSDFDFLVDFDPPIGMNRFGQYFGLLDDLRQALGRNVDLIDRRAQRNERMRASAESEAVDLYAA